MDFFARSTWAGLNGTGVGTAWQQFVSQTTLSAACPKVGIGFFCGPDGWYATHIFRN